MQPGKPAYSAFIVWRWGDAEIEDPKRLRRQLKDIHARGFKGVAVALWKTRYEVIDPKVIVAVAQASQWIKARNMIFWFQADPRQASRTLIFKTGERLQNLIVTQEPKNWLDPDNLNLVKIINNKFTLHYNFPKNINTSIIQEVSLNFEPSGLERAFLFQMTQGQVISKSIIDITKATRFFANMEKGFVEVFGDVSVPFDETWWVMAFPRFDTNLTDFAGHESRHYLRQMVDQLFDTGAYIDGITWDNSGDCGDFGRFPVSESIYQSFLAQFGYSLKDHLLALVLDFTDDSHVKLRQHYYKLLMDTVYSAQYELKTYFHSFFGKIDCTLPHVWQPGDSLSYDLACGNIDPWQGLQVQETGMTIISCSENPLSRFNEMLARLAATRSLGLFSNSRNAYVSFSDINTIRHEMNCWVDLMLMNSVRWMIQAYSEQSLSEPAFADSTTFPKHKLWYDLELFNQKIEAVGEITHFSPPVSNIILVYPVETIMSVDVQSAEYIIAAFYQFAAELILAGIQIDIISTDLLREGRLTNGSIRIGHRHYQQVLYPYPEIIHPDLLDLVSVMKRREFPIFLGGSEPYITSTGEKVPYRLESDFDPEAFDAEQLNILGIQPLFELPDHCIGTKIYSKMKTCYLLRADSPDGQFSGRMRDGELTVDIPPTQNLIIFQADEGQKLEQVYPILG